MDIITYIDHTLLKPTATKRDIEILCQEAIRYHFYAVCVNGSRVEEAAAVLKDSSVKLASVIGFPLGAMSESAKIREAAMAVENGADEIDMVLNIGWLKENRWPRVEQEIAAIKQQIGSKVLKVILENCYLTKEEIRRASLISMYAGADFIKTSTGFGSGGATEEDVILMKETVGDGVGIKASGGIRDKATALRYIALGATRIGTSSGVNIITQL